MEQNNFEKQVQQKLNNREIKPSLNSWDRLDAMLSVEEKPKKKGFFWINIAASFIVLASIGYYFYNQNQILIPAKEDSIIVEENSKSRIQNSENNQENIDFLEESQEPIAKNQEVLVENNTHIKGNKNSSISKEHLVAISETNNQQPTTNNQQGVSIINPSLEKTINQVSTVNNNKIHVSPKKLLAEVSKDYLEVKNLIENNKPKRVVTVNPNLLLSNTESEINQTFREAALEKLNKNFNSIKTVLVNRNYEE